MPIIKKHKPDIHVFIGYDPTQDLAWDVCARSIKTTSSSFVNIIKLDALELRRKGLFDRTWQVEGDSGRWLDLKDGRPFSTTFAHSRFIVPEYARYLGIRGDDVAIFVDSDFVFLDDIHKILADCPKWRDFPVSVVKHNYTSTHKEKMVHAPQTNYPMKLWSSLMMFNLQHPKTYIKRSQVNCEDGSWLHSFSWLSPSEIGNIPESWNFIPDHSEERIKQRDIKAIHFTEGTPLMAGYEHCRYAEVFNFNLRELYRDYATK